MKKLLILDLDETLIHATKEKIDSQEDFVFADYYIYKRPNLHNFLMEISNHFEIGIWSSASDEYVLGIVDKIIPPTINLNVVWGRSKCSMRKDDTFDEYYFEKRLDKLKKKGFRLDQILIVDDTREKSRTNFGNAIHIHEFTGNMHDEELNHLKEYLLTLKNVENVRLIEKRYWRTAST